MNLEKLCAYQVWADTAVRNLIKDMSDEKFTCEIGPPFKSIQALCVHIVVALEYNIESFLKKGTMSAEKLYETLGTLSKNELLAKWEEADLKLLKSAKTFKDTVKFPNFLTGGELAIESEDFFLQYILHTTYHRGQLLNLIKSLGEKGVTTDYLFYLFDIEKQR
jgi:uncharacterized damage-inducible protein DinB